MNAAEEVREAEAWFRERGFVSTSKVDARHAATIVRAWLARDVPAPAGRDLTAGDVWNVLEAVGGSGPRQVIADRLNGIARPSGGVGQPEYAVSNWVRVPTTDGDTVTVGAPALDRRPHPDSRWDTRTEAWESQAAEPCAADGPRDSLGIVRCVRAAGHDGDHQAHDSWNLVTWENEPPAPEPQAAEPPADSRGFYRLARDLHGELFYPAGSLVMVTDPHVSDEVPHVYVSTPEGTEGFTLDALAAAGAERMEER